MRDCSACRWFSKAGVHQVDGESFVHGNCNRPEGPLDPRTTRAQVYEHHGHTMTRPAGMAVSAETGLVSAGMGCQAFEARFFETDVTQVTARDRADLDLWGNPNPEEGP